MKLHSDTLTLADIRDAAQTAGVDFHRLAQAGSRSRARAFDVVLEGLGVTGTRRGAAGGYGAGDYIAATWDEWGIFLGELFRRDPGMRATYYEDGEHFRWSTGARFDTLTPADQHTNHKWSYSGESVTGAYFVRECRKCGAINRYLTRAKWGDISGALTVA